ncbi:hypothetical protein DEO72_LG3g2043 [Vigna unguiculata]|uniref:Uncharacterized protein n=1 Tax=Vigna unguiculata TaxID=3917 RepID=A0A4D6LFZ9_VIGUN|nr:hypothetical protein DEO72_LG3g2043 [Vigna unguiculata]
MANSWWLPWLRWWRENDTAELALAAAGLVSAAAMVFRRDGKMRVAVPEGVRWWWQWDLRVQSWQGGATACTETETHSDCSCDVGCGFRPWATEKGVVLASCRREGGSRWRLEFR